MTRPKHSMHSLAYVSALRRTVTREPTWLDVAAAYDEGLRHAVEATSTKRRDIASYLRALRVVNAARAEVTNDKEKL